jgi:hypothetical protein
MSHEFEMDEDFRTCLIEGDVCVDDKLKIDDKDYDKMN